MVEKNLARELIQLMLVLEKSARTYCKELKEDLHFTEKQFRLVMLLNSRGKIKLKELSQMADISNSSICIMLNKMVDDGLVERETDTVDRRDTYYYLTDKGINLIEIEKEKRINKINLLIDSKLDQQDKEELLKSIIDMRTIVQKMS